GDRGDGPGETHLLQLHPRHSVVAGAHPGVSGIVHHRPDRRHSMPVQRFAPMTKDFATFDCDAHVTDPPLIWERAHEFLTRDELAALRSTIWWDNESQQLIVNGRAGVGIGSQRR